MYKGLLELWELQTSGMRSEGAEPINVMPLDVYMPACGSQPGTDVADVGSSFGEAMKTLEPLSNVLNDLGIGR